MVKKQGTKVVALGFGTLVVCIILILSFTGTVCCITREKQIALAVVAAAFAFATWYNVYYAKYALVSGVVGAGVGVGGCSTCGGASGGCPTCISGGCMTCGGGAYGRGTHGGAHGGGLGIQHLQKIPALITSTRQLSADVKSICAAVSNNPALTSQCQQTQSRLQTVDGILALLPP